MEETITARRRASPRLRRERFNERKQAPWRFSGVLPYRGLRASDGDVVSVRTASPAATGNLSLAATPSRMHGGMDLSLVSRGDQRGLRSLKLPTWTIWIR